MESNELYFGLLLGLMAAVVGGIATVWSANPERVASANSSATAGVADRLFSDSYRELQSLTKAHLADRLRRDTMEQLSHRIGDYGGGFPDPFTGVLFLKKNAQSPEAILRSFDGDPDFMEGPPFHLVADRSGLLHAARRWRDGRPWRLSHETNPDGWVIICLLGCQSADGDIPTFLNQLASKSQSAIRLGETHDLLAPMTPMEWHR